MAYATVSKSVLEQAEGHIKAGYYLDARGLLRGSMGTERQREQKARTNAQAARLRAGVSREHYAESLVDAMADQPYEHALACQAVNDEYPRAGQPVREFNFNDRRVGDATDQ